RRAARAFRATGISGRSPIAKRILRPDHPGGWFRDRSCQRTSDRPKRSPADSERKPLARQRSSGPGRDFSQAPRRSAFRRTMRRPRRREVEKNHAFRLQYKPEEMRDRPSRVVHQAAGMRQQAAEDAEAARAGKPSPETKGQHKRTAARKA